jgi:hypothetical protein
MESTFVVQARSACVSNELASQRQGASLKIVEFVGQR